jgi:hypothetical protein
MAFVALSSPRCVPVAQPGWGALRSNTRPEIGEKCGLDALEDNGLIICWHFVAIGDFKSVSRFEDRFEVSNAPTRIARPKVPVEVGIRRRCMLTTDHKWTIKYQQVSGIKITTGSSKQADAARPGCDVDHIRVEDDVHVVDVPVRFANVEADRLFEILDPLNSAPRPDRREICFVDI